MGKMKDLMTKIDEEFERVFNRQASDAEAQEVLTLMLRHDMTVSEAISFLQG